MQILSFGDNSFDEDNQSSPAKPLIESNKLLKIKENLESHEIKNNSFIKNNFYDNFAINKEVLHKYKKSKIILSQQISLYQ